MIKPQPLVLAALALLCAPAWAQVYRCPDASGRTVIQQVPCAGGQQMNVKPAAGKAGADVAATRSAAAALCEAALRKAPAWKDPDSVQISDVVRVGFTTIQLHGTTLAVVKYCATTNAKNSYGGYVGQKPAFCYLNGTETKVLDIKVF